jgi:hypothetical protein
MVGALGLVGALLPPPPRAVPDGSVPVESYARRNETIPSSTLSDGIIPAGVYPFREYTVKLPPPTLSNGSVPVESYARRNVTIPSQTLANGSVPVESYARRNETIPSSTLSDGIIPAGVYPFREYTVKLPPPTLANGSVPVESFPLKLAADSPPTLADGSIPVGEARRELQSVESYRLLVALYVPDDGSDNCYSDSSTAQITLSIPGYATVVKSFMTDPAKIGNWYTEYDETITVNSASFTSAIASTIRYVCVICYPNI